MAVTTIDAEFATVAATSTETTLTLEPDREYTIVHTGLQTDASTADSAIIYLYVVTAGITTDLSEEIDKYPLMVDEAVVVGPAISTLFYKTASGSPVFTVLASPPKFGQW